MKVLLSGTATPNGRHMELAPQIDLLGSRAWADIGGRGYYFKHFAPRIKGTPASLNGEELHDLVTRSWFTRVLRADVPNLFGDVHPIKLREPLPIEAIHTADYLSAETDLIAYLKSKGEKVEGAERAYAIVQLSTMLKLCGQMKVQGVVDHVTELLEDAPGVLIGAENKSVIEGLLFGLKKHYPAVVQGGMTDKAKQTNIDNFNSGRSRVLVGQLQAAGVGLTLHGGGRNHRVIMAQLPWAPATLEQFEDRLYRIGQTHDVISEVALAAIDGTWTIDERVWSVLEQKHFNSKRLSDGRGEWLLESTLDSILDSYRQM